MAQLCPRLLVSVRSAWEAEEALVGGADVIDVKDPDRGSLGRAEDSVLREIRERVAGRRTLSAALGELAHFGGDYPAGFDFLKWGPAGLSEDWRSRIESAHAQCGAGCPVLVAYADWQCANAPPLDDIVDFACERPRSVLLIDTHCKDKNAQGRRPTLLDWLPIPWLGEVLRKARASRVRVALAGSLDADAIAKIVPMRPDWIAVRGAACRRQERRDDVDRERVRAIKSLLDSRQ